MRFSPRNKKRVGRAAELVLILAGMFIFTYSAHLLAAPPGSPYTPAETLNPSCGPADTNCYVDITGPGLVIPTQTGNSGKALTTDGSSLSWGTFLSSLNGLTAATQTFADVDDTNVTLAINSATSTHTFTLGWTGQLAAGRGGTGIDTSASTGIATIDSGTWSILSQGAADTLLAINDAGDGYDYRALGVGTAGTNFTIASADGTITFNLPDASASARGAVTTSDQTFAGTKTTPIWNASTQFNLNGSFFATQNEATRVLRVGKDAGAAGGGATDNTFLGFQAGTATNNDAADFNTFVGSQAGLGNINGNANVYIGYGAGGPPDSGVSNVIIGSEAVGGTASFRNPSYAILIGADSDAGGRSSSIGIGYGTVLSADNQLVIGGSSANGAISQAYLGNGVTNAAPQSITINATGGSGTDIAGADFTLAGGQPTGNATAGSIVFSTATTGGSSGTTLRALKEHLRIDGATGFVKITENGTAIVSPSYQFEVHDNTNTNVAAFINGVANCIVTPTVGVSCTSDIRKKQNISQYEDALTTVNALRGVTFDWKDAQPGDPRRIGFIAQEVEEVLPELVITDSQGFKTLSYASFTPILTEAIKELDLRLKGVEAVQPTQNVLATLRDSVLEVRELIATTIRAKKISTERGLEIKDKATGDIYCVTIENGEWSKILGECSLEDAPAPVTETVTPPEEETVTEETVEEAPAEETAITEETTAEEETPPAPPEETTTETE